MKTVLAGQLIFTQVLEESASPTGRRNEQTVFCSRADGPKSAGHPKVCLDAAEVLDIEGRLFYHPPSNEDGVAGADSSPRPLDSPAKHLFFPTTAGKIALGRIVARPGVDSAGRSGLYFAHVLVFDRDDFVHHLHANPFAVIDDFAFRHSLDEIPEADTDRATGDIAPCPVSPLDAEPTLEASSIDVASDQFRKLLIMAAQAEIMVRRDRHALALLGKPEAALALLRALFACQPAALRATCSFDTLFTLGSLDSTQYWAIGLPAGQSCPATAFGFDLEQRRFTLEFERPPQQAYERWLVHLLATGNRLERVLQHHDASHELALRFERLTGNSGSEPRSPSSRVDSVLVREYLHVHDEFVRARLKKLLLTQMGARLGQDYFKRIVRLAVTPDAGKLLRTLESGRIAPLVVRSLYDEFQSRSTSRPDDEMLDGLKIFLRHLESQDDADGFGTRLLLMYRRWRQQWKKLRADLWNHPQVHRDWFLTWVLDSLKYAVKWRIGHYEDGYAFGYWITCADAADIAIIDLLLGLTPVAPHDSLKKGDGRTALDEEQDVSILPVASSTFDLSPSRRPWLVEILLAGIDDDSETTEKPAALETNDWKRLNGLMAMLKQKDWKALRATLAVEKELVVRAFAAKARLELRGIDKCIFHLDGGLLFGVFVGGDRRRARDTKHLLAALLNMSDDYRPQQHHRLARQHGWRDRFADWLGGWMRLDREVSKRRSPRDSEMAPEVYQQWPLMLQILVERSQEAKTPAASGIVADRA